MTEKTTTTIDLNSLEVTRSYLSGMQFTREAIRKYKCSIKVKGNPFFDETVYLEVVTKKKGGYYGQWGEGKFHYYFDGGKGDYGSLIDALKSKYNIINDNPELLK